MDGGKGRRVILFLSCEAQIQVAGFFPVASQRQKSFNIAFSRLDQLLDTSLAFVLSEPFTQLFTVLIFSLTCQCSDFPGKMATAFTRMPWTKQIFLGFIPAFPLGYLVFHTNRFGLYAALP